MDRSEHQLRVSLQQKGYALEDIDAVVQKLADLDYLNDRRFAEAYVRSNSNRLGIGQLRRKLQERGVAESIVVAAISEYAQPDQFMLAVEIAERRFQAISNLPPQTVERRISSLLLRRGFNSATVWAAIRHLQQRN